jgi:prepilin-type N-terminal cleavage/methylation domain-containing protein/prepilin-type processing-associated H-X9-DG protein
MEVVVERRRNAFTLIELLVVIAIIALLIGILLPALGQAQRSAKNVLSQSNQRSLNTGAANYASDNSDAIFSYTWRAGETYLLPDGRPKTAGDDQAAAAFQNQEILQRVTGRVSGQYKILRYDSRLPHRRYSHLVLLDFLTDVQPEPIAASPFDRNLIQWQENTLDYNAGSGVPYADGVPDGYDDDGEWATTAVRQRWPFASTYQMVPTAWNTDGLAGQATYYPVPDTPHLFRARAGARGEAPPLGRRRFTQVAHPSGKVMLFEEFDRFSDKDGLYFAYPEAKCNLAFFDGSVRNLQTAESNPGWNPNEPEAEWTQNYVPLDTFPLPKNGLNDGAQYCQRYRWTRFGLQGVDFGGQDVGRRRVGLPDDADCSP